MNTKLEQLVHLLSEYSDLLSSSARVGRPLVGGVWGVDRVWLGSRPSLVDGFYVVTYLVMERDGGAVIGSGDTKADALRSARDSVTTAGSLTVLLSLIADARADALTQRATERAKFAAERQALFRYSKTNQFRRDVFDKSNGLCHYCGIGLAYRENWHVEHMTPRARGGSDDIENLVASCLTCNLVKGTKTAEEFMETRIA